MKARLTVDTDGEVRVCVWPDTDAEKLILCRLAEVKQVDIVRENKGYNDLNYLLFRPTKPEVS